jgi:hypothetical protein
VTGKRCGEKRRYRDEVAAKLALSRIATFGEQRETMPTRAYPCPICRGWHLTSQPRREKPTP